MVLLRRLKSPPKRFRKSVTFRLKRRIPMVLIIKTTTPMSPKTLVMKKMISPKIKSKSITSIK